MAYQNNLLPSALSRSGFIITITLSLGQLDFTVGVPGDKFTGKLKGLLGAFDGDQSNDLLPSGVSATPLPANSTESQIYYQFGESC